MLKDIEHWWGLDLEFELIYKNISARCQVLVALKINKALKNHFRDINTYEKIMMNKFIRVFVIIITENKYFSCLWNLNSTASSETSLDYSMSEILDLNISETTFIAYKINDLDIINIVFQLNQKHQLLWVLKSYIRSHHVCYYYSVNMIKKVWITRNVCSYLMLRRDYL